MNVKTNIRKTSTGHQVEFTIGVQTFFLQERTVFPSCKLTSLEYAQWYEKMLKKAFENLKQDKK